MSARHGSFAGAKTKGQLMSALAGVLFQKHLSDAAPPRLDTLMDIGRWVQVPHLFKFTSKLGVSDRDVRDLCERMKWKAEAHRFVEPFVKKHMRIILQREVDGATSQGSSQGSL